jgi:hypothetical protein
LDLRDSMWTRLTCLSCTDVTQNMHVAAAWGWGTAERLTDMSDDGSTPGDCHMELEEMEWMSLTFA